MDEDKEVANIFDNFFNTLKILIQKWMMANRWNTIVTYFRNT